MVKQLFIDEKFIAQSQGIVLRTNPPELRGPVLLGEMPWEAGWMHYACVLQDGELVKMWYGAHPPSEDGKLGPHYFCYAISHDGVHWERPSLGLVEFDGSRENNILPIRGDFVFIDPKALSEQLSRTGCGGIPTHRWIHSEHHPQSPGPRQRSG